jgi:hypothetical protein
MTKSTAWRICVPLRARLWRQGHGLYPASPAGLVLRSLLVERDCAIRDVYPNDCRSNPSRILSVPITVLGKRVRQIGPRAEFAKVQLTVHPSDSFEVIDRVAERSDLEKLGVGWPDCAIFECTKGSDQPPRPRLNVNIVIGELCAEFDTSRGICTFLCPRENSSTGISA